MTAIPQGEVQPQRSRGWRLSIRNALLGSRNAFIGVTCLVLFSLAICAPILWYGAPDGADADSALMWMHGFVTQVSLGDLYPRWLMDINRGAGSPAFYFYAPLPFYIGWLPTTLLAHQPLNIQLAWFDWILVLLSGLSFFFCARRRVSNARALFAGALYMVLPYHFETDLWVREDLGELTNYIWMPLVFYFTDLTLEHKDVRFAVGLSVSYALMVLSHLPSTLIMSICLCVYLGYRLISAGPVVPLVRFVASVAIGGLIAGVYWVPAIFSQQYIHAEAWWTWYYDFHLWFFPVRSLEAFHGDAESLAFDTRVFEVVCATLAMFVLFWLAAWRRRTILIRSKLIGCALLVGTACFLMTPLSAFVWESFPPLAKIQFPSRLAMIVDLGTALAALDALPQKWRREWPSTVATAITLMLLMGCFVSADLKSHLDPFNDSLAVSVRNERVRDGVDPPEYTTRWSPFDPHADADDNSRYIAAVRKLSYDSSAGVVTLISWRPRRIELRMHLRRPTTLIVRQFYFPNWRARVVGGDSFNVAPNPANGLITLSLPAGNYQTSLVLEPSVQERLGYITSGVGLLMLGVLYGIGRQKTPESKPRRHKRFKISTAQEPCRADTVIPFLRHSS